MNYITLQRREQGHGYSWHGYVLTGTDMRHRIYFLMRTNT